MRCKILSALATARPETGPNRWGEINRLPVAEKYRGPRADLASLLDAADRLQPRPRMDFRLRQHGGLLPEALDQRTHEGPDRRRGHQHRRLAIARGLFEAVAYHGHELGQL